MHLRQFIYSAVLIGIFGAVAKSIPPRLRVLWGKFVHGLCSLARHKTVCWIGVGVFVLVLRLALLPVWPIPAPSIYDEFSYLLQADTFSHGRLTNLPHPLWKFFESPYILQQPTYASRFPPAQALVMAAGQVFLGHPWFGVWLSAGILAAVLCWALQGWLPPGWALLGAFIGLNLCLFTYWMNSYWGGAVTAIGGALVIGAWVRIVRAKQWRYAWLFGIGAVIVILARPFEGLLLLVPALIALAIANRSLRVWIPVAFIGIIGASIINIFWQNDGLQFVVSVIGVIVFTGLTAYDAQRLKAMALSLPSGQTGSYAVVGALALYLDFINLFLMLLRFTGQRRD